MSEAKTKSCNLTESEIKQLINNHGIYASSDPDMHIERMNYLNKRLKTFSEPEVAKAPEPQPAPAPSAEQEKVGW